MDARSGGESSSIDLRRIHWVDITLLVLGCYGIVDRFIFIYFRISPFSDRSKELTAIGDFGKG